MRLLTLSRVQLDGNCDQCGAKYDGIGTEPPGQYERSNEGSRNQQHAISHRYKTGQREPPSAVIELKTQSCAQHQSARDYCPGAYEKDEAYDCDAGPQECDYSRDDVDDTLQQQKSPSLAWHARQL